MPPSFPGSAPSSLLPSPARLRTLAAWLDEAGSPRMAEAARVAAHRLEADAVTGPAVPATGTPPALDEAPAADA